MNFFEQELRKLFGQGQVFEKPSFAGRVCMGTLGADLVVRVQFAAGQILGQYDTLHVFVKNRSGGVVDTLCLDLKDLLGRKAIPDNPHFEDGVDPHICEYGGETEWYVYLPNEQDYQIIRQAVDNYLEPFRDQRKDHISPSPRLVYICAPLRGDVEKNIAFARQKAQEVFAGGDIPICPHMMFPPIADPADPAQDQKAREMGLRLVESCQQLNVYGSEWTEGMGAEIARAGQLGIPIRTDQKAIGKTVRNKKTRPQR